MAPRGGYPHVDLEPCRALGGAEQQTVQRAHAMSAHVELHEAAHLNGGGAMHNATPSVSVARTTRTDRRRHSNTSQLCVPHTCAERDTACCQSERAGFERDERAAGMRTVASGVREEMHRHVDLPSPPAVILLATAAPARPCGEYSMVVP